jgi:hypothetical protein
MELEGSLTSSLQPTTKYYAEPDESSPRPHNLMMEEASTSETSVNFYQTTRRNNPENRYLQLKIRIQK